MGLQFKGAAKCQQDNLRCNALLCPILIDGSSLSLKVLKHRSSGPELCL